jgi:menaquinone-dependent protoporphyrinogen oxidase
MLGDALQREGLDVVLEAAETAVDLSRFDAVIVGGALYANRWHRAARRFVKRNAEELRAMPVWFFSSGPLDDSAEQHEILPTKQVSALMDRVGARGHTTFGGRLAPDATGFIASKIAKKRAGDWRNVDHVRAWATEVATSLRTVPQRRPRIVPPRPEPSRAILAALCLFAGLTAIWGGLELLWSPDGAFMRLPLSLLHRTPFHDFRVPGLLLAGFVGVINTLAGVLVLRRHPRADAEAMVSGSLLVAWIVIEVLLIRHVHWLHGAYLALGLMILSIGTARERRAGELANTARALFRVLVHALVGWALCGATMGAVLATTSLKAALLVHALAAPLIFAGVSASYFRGQHAWAPLRAASVVAVLVGLFDLVIVASFIQRSLAMFQSVVGSWLPLLLIFAVTWMTGTLRKHGPPIREAHART